MKYLFTIFTMCMTMVLSAQDSFTEADAKQIVDTFFEGFHSGDTIVMKSVMRADMIMQTAFSTKEGENKISDSDAVNLLNAIGSRPSDQKWDERILDYKVSVDGNLAHVWTPYEFWFNGTFSHCGANAFTLAKTDDGWKIIHLIDSRRKESCKKS